MAAETKAERDMLCKTILEMSSVTDIDVASDDSDTCGAKVA